MLNQAEIDGGSCEQATREDSHEFSYLTHRHFPSTEHICNFFLTLGPPDQPSTVLS
jgi:hypothetical protein